MEVLQNAPALIDNDQFGNLVKLPSVLRTNQERATKAGMVVNAKINEVAKIDLTTIDASRMEEHDGELAELYARLNKSLELMEGDRKPHTQFMDMVKSLFTKEESTIKNLKDQVKGIRDNWQAEKARRARIAQEELDRKIAEEQESIRVRAEKFTRYTQSMLREIGRRIELLSNGFYAQGLTTIDAYARQLRDMVPMLNGTEYDKIIGEVTPLSAELYNQLSSEFMGKLHAERNRLLDLVESRKVELIRISQDAAAAEEARLRIEKENEERAAALVQEQQEREQVINDTAQAEATNATFDAHMEATPVVGISKGTVVKKKYVVHSHAGMVALLQSFIKHNLGLMTIDEMNKKFSFIITAANARLSEETIEAKGLEVVEDYSTRSTRKAS